MQENGYGQNLQFLHNDYIPTKHLFAIELISKGTLKLISKKTNSPVSCPIDLKCQQQEV